MKNLLAAGITALAILTHTGAQAATVGLYGTSFTTQVQYQPTASDPRQAISFQDTSIVGANIEFPNLANLQVDTNPFGLTVVPVSVNVGDDFIELDYSIAGSGSFAGGFFNGYMFQFDSGVPIEFQNASIEQGVTTLAVADSDLSFVGNQLFLNVGSRSFNSGSFVRISAQAVEVAPVPLPASLPLLLVSLMGGVLIMHRKSAA